MNGVDYPIISYRYTNGTEIVLTLQGQGDILIAFPTYPYRTKTYDLTRPISQPVTSGWVLNENQATINYLVSARFVALRGTLPVNPLNGTVKIVFTDAVASFDSLPPSVISGNITVRSSEIWGPTASGDFIKVDSVTAAVNGIRYSNMSNSYQQVHVYSHSTSSYLYFALNAGDTIAPGYYTIVQGFPLPPNSVNLHYQRASEPICRAFTGEVIISYLDGRPILTFNDVAFSDTSGTTHLISARGSLP